LARHEALAISFHFIKEGSANIIVSEVGSLTKPGGGCRSYLLMMRKSLIFKDKNLYFREMLRRMLASSFPDV